MYLKEYHKTKKGLITFKDAFHMDQCYCKCKAISDNINYIVIEQTYKIQVEA